MEASVPLMDVSPGLLEACIPASLAVAAAICWLDPTRFPSVVFGFCALGFVYRDDFLALLSRPLSAAVTITVEDFLRDQHRFDRLLLASTDALKRVIESGPLRATLKGAIVESMQDKELDNMMLETVKNAIVKSSQDEDLLVALTKVAKHSLLEALRDKDFMKDSVSSLVAAMLAAAKDEDVKRSLMDVATDAISTALQDEKFVTIIRDVIKETLSVSRCRHEMMEGNAQIIQFFALFLHVLILMNCSITCILYAQDGAIYRSGASGVARAFLPASFSGRS
jgi:hypothetical protein